MLVDGTGTGEQYGRRTFMKYFTAGIGADNPGQIALLNCNDAIARGAIEAGVRVIASYPGSPLQYCIDSLVAARSLYPEMHVEWSTNEKIAFEAAFGASFAGVRGMAVMKNVGMNWIVDPLIHGAQCGGKGVVVVVCDDPEAETTGDVQDSRYLARFAMVPVLEPSTMQEVKDFTQVAFDLSDEVWIPVVVRVHERLGWGREPVVFGRIQHHIRQRIASANPKDPWNWGIQRPPHGPIKGLVNSLYQPYLRRKNEANEDILDEVGELPNDSAIAHAVISFPHNRLAIKDGARVGVITAGMCYTVLLEALDILGAANEVSVLKLATTYPLPTPLVKQILETTETVLVLDEIEPFIEEQVRSISAEMDNHARILGKLTGHIPYAGEMSRHLAGLALAKIIGRSYPGEHSVERAKIGKDILQRELQFCEPQRLSGNCPGCPEYAAIFAFKSAAEEQGVSTFVFGDEGCIGATRHPPRRMLNVLQSMGTSIGEAHGLAKAGICNARIVSFLGDSCFFHAGLPELANAVYNKSDLLICVLDNGSTAMTGHQPHPGNPGITACGERTVCLDIAKVAHALGAPYVRVIDPYDQKQARAIFREALAVKGVRVVVAKRTCAIVAQRERHGATLGVSPQIDRKKCLSWTVEATPCQRACPLGCDVEAYQAAIARSDFGRAMAIIREVVPLPGLCGWVCSRPCEEKCKRGKVDEPIAIRGLKRFVVDYVRRHGREKAPSVAVPKQLKVAIIGSGPTGLSAAHDLATGGYSVTVFEAGVNP